MSLPKVCIVPVCDRESFARGYCGAHYNRWRTGKSLDTEIKGTAKPRPQCSYEGCTRPRNTAGLCNVHWIRKQRGDINSPVREVNPERGCLIENCNEPHLSLGYCNTHYQRMRTGGDMSNPIRRGYRGLVCVIPGCDYPVRSSAMCKGHYSTSFAYNLSSVQLMTIFAAGCSICGEMSGVRIDHDHSCCEYGKSCGSCVRGGLCSNCNTAIGLFKEDVNRIRVAISYLSSKV